MIPMQIFKEKRNHIQTMIRDKIFFQYSGCDWTFFFIFFLLTWLLLFEIGPVWCICSVSANENLGNISCQFVTGHTPIRGDIIHFDVSELYKK